MVTTTVARPRTLITVTRISRVLLGMTLLVCIGSMRAPLQAEEVAIHSPREIINGLGMRFVRIEPGKFVMGSPETQPGRQEREHAHEVEITRAFYLGVHEVTQAEYRAVLVTNPSHFGRQERRESLTAGERFDRHPVDSVNWHDAMRFCEELSKREAEQKAGRRYRLPTEAEWEYACRAGATGIWTWGDDRKLLPEFAWYRQRGSELTTQPVGQKRANAWGLHDMHGNVWEWCSDWYAEDLRGSDGQDPRGPEEGQSKVIRGGAYQSIPAYTRSATRFHDPPEIGDHDVGLRVVLELTSD